MHKILSLLFLCFLLNSCSDKENPTTAPTPFEQHVQEQHDFMLSGQSPLSPTDKKNFIQLNRFPYDSSFRVTAEFQSTFNGRVFEMATNTDRRPKYQHYANLLFQIKGQAHTLEAYKSLEHNDSTLFIPFGDETNLTSSYHSGRYIDLAIPNANQVILDFNFAYNPYCSYNKKYSCPIPPAPNRLDIAIKAGEKRFHN